VIPEEDRGPAWLRDYGYTDFGDIAADIAAMEEFAKKLAADVQSNYSPHLTGVSEAMLTRLPPPDGRFSELVSFMTAHHAAQGVTHENVYNYANGTDNMATVAQEISQKYRGTDAFAKAQVSDVRSAFNKLAVSEAETNGDA
jgi:hypothetical protein